MDIEREAEKEIIPPSVGGEARGLLNLRSTPYENARGYGERIAEELCGRRLLRVLPEFSTRYPDAQAISRVGRVQRRDMPVLSDESLALAKDRKLLTPDCLCEVCESPPSGLIPTQSEIWADKSIRATLSNGPLKTAEFLSRTRLWVDRDLHILDGHHRWLSGMLLGMVSLPLIRVKMPLQALIPMLNDLARQQGNVPNE